MPDNQMPGPRVSPWSFLPRAYLAAFYLWGGRQDHENAEVLARGLAALPGIHVKRTPGSTNAVYFQVGDEPRGVYERMVHIISGELDSSSPHSVYALQAHVGAVIFLRSFPSTSHVVPYHSLELLLIRLS